MEIKQKPLYVAIAGNIGAGKTTLTRMLAKHYGWEAEFESVEGNPYLEDFYGAMGKWAFHLQIHFLNSRFRQIHRVQTEDKTVIQDRTIYEDAFIFAKSLHEQGVLNDRDYQNYLGLFDTICHFIRPPDLLIYLRCDMGKLVRNIEQRGRNYERTISIDYLKTLNRHYEEWIGQYTNGKLLILDVSDNQFNTNPEHFSEIVFKIDTEIHGLFS